MVLYFVYFASTSCCTCRMQAGLRIIKPYIFYTNITVLYKGMHLNDQELGQHSKRNKINDLTIVARLVQTMSSLQLGMYCKVAGLWAKPYAPPLIFDAIYSLLNTIQLYFRKMEEMADWLNVTKVKEARRVPWSELWNLLSAITNVWK